MRPDLVERHYLLPGLDRLFDAIGVKKNVGISHYLKFLRRLVKRFEIGSGTLSCFMESLTSFQETELIAFCMKYSEQLSGIPFADDDLDYNWIPQHYHLDTDNAIIDTSDLTTQSKFLKDMAQKGGQFSLTSLQIAFKVRLALKAKASQMCQTLSEILALKKPDDEM
jgi:hypothetical protein